MGKPIIDMEPRKRKREQEAEMEKLPDESDGSAKHEVRQTSDTEDVFTIQRGKRRFDRYA